MLDDDDVGITDLEICGYVRVEAPALGRYETIGPLFSSDNPRTVLLGASRNLNIARWK